MRPWIWAVALTLGLAVGPPVLADAAKVLKLEPAVQQRLGIATAPLAAAQRTATVSGFARGIDAAPLATLDSDIASAVAALSASQVEATRTRALNQADQTVSKQVAEVAATQARADAAKLTLLRRRLGLEWGPSIQALTDAKRGRLVADIAAGHAALIRIDASGGLTQFKGVATIDLGAAGSARAAILGPARVGDARLQSTGLLALITGPQAMRMATGTLAPATIAVGAASTGTVIPRMALLRTGGETFAYVRRDAGSFERRLVVDGAADPQGLVVTGGFRPGEQVVVKGAAQLYAAETPAKAE